MFGIKVLIINTIDFQNSKFQSLTPFQFRQLSNFNLNNLILKNVTLIRNSFMNIQNVQQLAILNTRLDANIISNKANGRVVDIEKITCTLNSAGNPLWIYDVRSINSNKISFLRIKQLVKDSSIIDVIYSTCNIKIAGVQVENNNLNTGQFISIGTSASEYYKLSLEDFIFTSNTILNNPLIELNLYSQEISMKNITFNNNQGQLIKFKPNSISSVKPYNQIVTITDIKFVNNINDEFSLISLEKQTQVTLTGSISGNTILSNVGLISIGEYSCSLVILNTIITDNFVSQGGILNVNSQSTASCSNCTFDQNYGIEPIISQIANDGMLQITNSKVTSNYALITSLISSNGNNQRFSIIETTQIVNSQYYDIKQRQQVIENRFKRVFNNLTAIQDLLNSEIENTLIADQLNIDQFNSRALDIKNSLMVLTQSTISNNIRSKEERDEYSMAIKAKEKNHRLSKSRNNLIQNSTFTGCQSENGGAIYSDNSNVKIMSTQFNQNKAQSGGALYFHCCQDCDNKAEFLCKYTFENNICSMNTAQIKGGCFYTDMYNPDSYETTTNDNNIAEYGNNYAAFPYQLNRVLYNPVNKQYEITTLNLTTVSGQEITEPLYFSINDMYNQIVSIENSAIGKLVPGKSDLTIAISDQNVSSNGIFTFTGTQFTSKPGYKGQYNLSSDIINDVVYQKIAAKNYQDLINNVTLRFCTYGEAIEGSKCINCQPGYFSLIENAEQCEQCPDHARCEGFSINPDLGYWRSSNMSTQVTKCYYDYACPGGTYNKCDTASGYVGILCHECVYINGDPKNQFTRKGDHQCARCPNTDENVRTYLLIFFGNQAYIFFLTYSYYKNLIHEKENTVLLRIFTTYTQIINLIGSFDLNWPTIIRDLFEGLGAPAKVTEALYSIDCLLNDFEVKGAEKTMMIQLMITSLQPLIQFALSIFVYFFAWVFRIKQIQIKMLVTMTVIYYLTYPKIVKDTFSLFTCTNSIDGVKYLVKNTEIECFGSTHNKLIVLLGLPNMVVWIFGAPFFILYSLYKIRGDLNNHDNLRKYGFWYLGCKRNRFYWELLLELKKLMMISVTVDITGMGQSYQAFLILMILYFYFILSSNLQPYKTKYLNNVSYYSEFGQLCTFAFMMVYLRESTNIVIDNLIFVLLLFMNSLFFLRFIYYLGMFYYATARDALIKIKNKIQKKPVQESDSDTETEKDEKDDFDKLDDNRRKIRLNGTKNSPDVINRKRNRRKIQTGSIYKASGSESIITKGGVKKKNSNMSVIPDQDDPQNLNNSQQGDQSPPPQLTHEERMQQKIESIKVLKEKKKQYKRKLLIKDGPVGIKIEDYIREEKMRIKRELKKDEAQIIQKKNEEQKEKLKEEEAIHIKDFDLKRDKNGHLLNAEVLDQINKLL